MLCFPNTAKEMEKRETNVHNNIFSFRYIFSSRRPGPVQGVGRAYIPVRTISEEQRPVD